MRALDSNNVPYEYYEGPNYGHGLVPFDQIAAISHGDIGTGGNYASLVDRALGLCK